MPMSFEPLIRDSNSRLITIEHRWHRMSWPGFASLPIGEVLWSWGADQVHNVLRNEFSYSLKNVQTAFGCIRRMFWEGLQTQRSKQIYWLVQASQSCFLSFCTNFSARLDTVLFGVSGFTLHVIMLASWMEHSFPSSWGSAHLTMLFPSTFPSIHNSQKFRPRVHIARHQGYVNLSKSLLLHEVRFMANIIVGNDRG